MWLIWTPRRLSIEAAVNLQLPFQLVHNILTTIGTRTFEGRVKEGERARVREKRVNWSYRTNEELCERGNEIAKRDNLNI